jgi:rare lipoprotein A
VVRGITAGVAAPTAGRSTSPTSGWTGEQKIGRPYTINGRTYVPARDDDYDATGISSWYGPNFHGRPTANGEIFDQNALTAAHPTLPIPAMIEVTNLENGRSTVLRLNDRGPFARDRILDVSRAAAVELGFLQQGTARVRVRYLGPPEGIEPAGNVADSRIYTVQQGDGRFRVQAGAFSQRANAEAMRRRLAGEDATTVEEAQVNGRNIYRVFVGGDLSRRQADALRRDLGQFGVFDATIVALN